MGNTSYLADLGDGSALVIDPERDPRPYLEAAQRHHLSIRHVAETHLHADFVSGARELVTLGAGLIAPRAGGLAHPHRGVEEADELVVGDLILQVMETPGHTPEHVSYLLRDGSTPLVLFSGGTLMAGGVARPDLVSSDQTAPLAHQAFASVRRVLGLLPSDVEVRPTHGAGSFCSSAGAASAEVTTVGAERATHPVMMARDAEGFVGELLSGLASYPPYFRRLREVNRMGPRVFGVDLPRLPKLKIEAIAAHIVIDVRPIERFAAGHIPGSVSIALRDSFGTWLGWLVKPAQGIVFVVDPDQDQRELVRQTLNVGHESIVGLVALDDWVEAGGEMATIDLLAPTDIDAGDSILDVRQSSEWALGRLAGAAHLELGDLAADPTGVDPGLVVHCGHGQRAMTAASLLARAGRPPAGVTTAGYAEIARAVGK